MEDVYLLIVKPVLDIMDMPITIFGYTFNLFTVVIFGFMVSLLITFIRFFIGGKS